MARNNDFRVALAWLTAGLVTIEVLIVLAFVPSSAVARYNAAERAAVSADLGSATEAKVLDNANFWFDLTLVRPGFYAAFNKYLFDADDKEFIRDSPGPQYVEDRVATFWRVLFAVYYRIAAICIWLPYLLPLILATLVDALQSRRVRQWRFSYVSPMTRAWSARTRFGLTCLLILAVLLPVHVPAMFYPILLGGLVFTTWVSVTHLQKRI